MKTPIRISPPSGRLRLTARAPRVVIRYGAALVDVNSGELASTYRDAVVRALPVGVEPSEQWWRELASAIADYFTVQERDAERPPKLIREVMQNIVALIDPLGKELSTIRRLPLSMEWGDAASQLLTALAVTKNLAVREAERYNNMIAATRGHDPHQLLLYAAVIDLWSRGLDQRLHYSRGGPLGRFFKAVVGPALGEKMPGDSRIGAIVEDIRERTFSNSRK